MVIYIIIYDLIAINIFKYCQVINIIVLTSYIIPKHLDI